MKRTSTFLFFFFFFFCNAKASVKYWIGSGASANWSDAGNWSGGVPSFNDTVFFDAVNSTVNVNVVPNIAGLQIINQSNVVFSSSAATLMTIGNLNVSGLLVFKIEKGSSLTLEGTVATKGVSIQTFGNFTTSSAVIEGTFVLGAFASTWNVNSFPASFCTTTISGTVRVAATNTGSVMTGGISNGNPGTITFAANSVLDWQRSGGSAPNANFANGSLINVKGITSTNMNFNSAARYDGLLVWDCAAQTISGSSAILLPAGNTLVDSVLVVNTGAGSLRMSTNPNGYTINSLEVNGGVLELSAPNSTTNNLSDTITRAFKITGGTVYGNATFNFDNLGAAYSNTLIVKGGFEMTGGTLDFTNRSAGNAPGGAFAMYVNGDMLQTGGRIKATKGFDAQNLLVLNGRIPQSLALSNMTDTISLVINNTTGVSLQSSLTLPYKLLLQNGYLQLNQHHCSVAAGKLMQSVTAPLPCLVTNGNGKLFINNIAGSQVFPLAPFAAGYNAVTITNTGIAKSYSASVAYGIQPTGNIDVLKMINRTWTINAAVPAADESTSFTFNYADSEKVAGAVVNPAAAMALGHYGNGSWSYGTYSSAEPDGGPVAYTAGGLIPASTDSLFVIGNAGFISGTYIFTGTGNWDLPANWAGSIVPPNPLPAGNEIIIDPAAGECVLNVSQTIAAGAKLIVSRNKKMLLPGNLIVQQ